MNKPGNNIFNYYKIIYSINQYEDVNKKNNTKLQQNVDSF